MMTKMAMTIYKWVPPHARWYTCIQFYDYDDNDDNDYIDDDQDDDLQMGSTTCQMVCKEMGQAGVIAT